MKLQQPPWAMLYYSSKLARSHWVCSSQWSTICLSTMPLWDLHGSQNESNSFYVPSNHELPHGSGVSRSPWQPTSHTTMLSGGTRVQTSGLRGSTSGTIKCKGTIAITEFDGERSIRGLSAPTIAPLTWHRSNHLHQFLTCTRWTRTAMEYASTQ